jgi:beta-aspartyl-dipeptidase (metallo-type)
MITLIRSATVFAPEPQGEKDVLIAGRQIVAVEEPNPGRRPPIDVVEALGNPSCPASLILTTHPRRREGARDTGAGDPREDIVAAGVTTVIGCLGTDGRPYMESPLRSGARG